MIWQISISILIFWLYKTDHAMGDSTAQVTDTTSSSVKIIWNTPEIGHSILEPNIFSLDYRSTCEMYTPATLTRNGTSGGYSITRASRKSKQDSGKWGSSHIFFVEILNETCIRINVDKLKCPDSIYRFNIAATTPVDKCGNKISESISILARTKAVVLHPFKFGIGAFHVYEHNAEELMRKVKIYWQPRLLDDRKYLIRIYIKGSGLEPVYVTAVSQAQGWLMMDIGLQAHAVVVRLIRGNWISEEYAETYIPAQEDILPAPSSKIRWVEAQNTTVLKWKKPEYKVNITSYTIFWLDTLDGIASQRIFDFVSVSPDTDWFLLPGNNFTFLGLSANSESTSSGLQLPCWR